jgi:hypothetical protein
MALSKIDVANMVTGATPVANGGTGLTSGTTNQFLKFTGSTTLASAADNAGITNASQWRLTSGLTGATDPVSANLEKVDTDGYASLGSDMTVSSGIWTFPSTGIWIIKAHANVYLNGDARHTHFAIHTTTDNSSYSLAASGYAFLQQTQSNTAQSGMDTDFIFDVTNVTTHKCKFAFENLTNSNATLDAGTAVSYTWFTFIRLGDT